MTRKRVDVGWLEFCEVEGPWIMIWAQGIRRVLAAFRCGPRTCSAGPVSPSFRDMETFMMPSVDLVPPVFAPKSSFRLRHLPNRLPPRAGPAHSGCYFGSCSKSLWCAHKSLDLS